MTKPTKGRPAKKVPSPDLSTLSDQVNELVRTRFIEVRKQRGFTQYTMAEDLGVTRDYISGIEKGRHLPALAVMVIVARKYKVDLNWLLGV